MLGKKLILISSITAMITLLPGCVSIDVSNDSKAEGDTETVILEVQTDGLSEGIEESEDIEEAHEIIEEESEVVEEEYVEMYNPETDIVREVPTLIISTSDYDVREDGMYLVKGTDSAISVENENGKFDALADAIAEYSDNRQTSQDEIDENAMEAKEEIIDLGFEKSNDYPHFEFYEYLYPERVDYKMVSLKEDSFASFGGAHGNNHITGITFDVETGEILGFDELFTEPDNFLSFFKDYCKRELVRLSDEKDFVLSHDYKEIVDSINPYEDEDIRWFFDWSGFTYVFEPYEMASFAVGAVYVNLPYEMMMPYLNVKYYPNEVSKFVGDFREYYIEQYEDFDPEMIINYLAVDYDGTGIIDVQDTVEVKIEDSMLNGMNLLCDDKCIAIEDGDYYHIYYRTDIPTPGYTKDNFDIDNFMPNKIADPIKGFAETGSYIEKYVDTTTGKPQIMTNELYIDNDGLGIISANYSMTDFYSELKTGEVVSNNGVKSYCIVSDGIIALYNEDECRIFVKE